MSDTNDFFLDLGAIEDPNAPLAPGRYRATLTDWSDKPSKSGDPMLTLTWTTESGRELRQWCVLKHANPTAERLGRARAKDVLIALGSAPDAKVKATEFLAEAVGREAIIEVSQKPDSRTTGKTIDPETLAETDVDPSKIKMVNNVEGVYPLT